MVLHGVVEDRAEQAVRLGPLPVRGHLAQRSVLALDRRGSMAPSKAWGQLEGPGQPHGPRSYGTATRSSASATTPDSASSTAPAAASSRPQSTGSQSTPIAPSSSSRRLKR